MRSGINPLFGDIQYKGYRYEPDVMRDHDVVKVFHDAIRPDGSTVAIDFTPYRKMRQEDFERWVDLGEPTRRSLLRPGVMDAKSLLELHEHMELVGPAPVPMPEHLMAAE